MAQRRWRCSGLRRTFAELVLFSLESEAVCSAVGSAEEPPASMADLSAAERCALASPLSSILFCSCCSSTAVCISSVELCAIGKRETVFPRAGAASSACQIRKVSPTSSYRRPGSPY